MPQRNSIAAKARRIQMILLDVDGVMTDGGLYYGPDGIQMKRFHAHDGYGVVRAREHGMKLGIISGRGAPAVEMRAKDLKLDEVLLRVDDKLAAASGIMERRGLSEDELAYIGDDLIDIPLLKAVGFSAAPRNALPPVKRVVDYVTTTKGGEGAVREFIDVILRHRRE